MSNGTTTWNYTYDADGLRTSKTDGTTYYSYVYSGDKLTYMIAGGKHIYFSYDASGTPMTIIYSGTVYYYVTNAQGDVIGLLDANGNTVATYAYDAWGNPITTSETITSEVGEANPLRYRSYVWDSETKLYYLQSRYYNPEIGRFINTDTFPVTGQGFTGTNMFAYCGNSPTARHDDSGYFWDTVFDVISLGFSIAEVIQNPDDPMAWVSVVADVASLVIPGVTGGGSIVKALTKTDDAIDVVKAVDNIGEVGETIVKYGDEIKLPTQIKTTDAVKAWDDFLGPNQTSYNKFTKKFDPDRIFSADGTKSVRFGKHEMSSLKTRKAHFHYETWTYYSSKNTVYVTNTLQRLK